MAASCWRVYIKPFDSLGTYTNWVEVTQDVDFSGLGTLTQDLDNTQYDIGVYRNSNVTLKLNNYQGYYSDVDQLTSIFQYKRANSLVKITWANDETGAYCGIAECGAAVMADEATVLQGLLTDETSSMNAADQYLSFQVLGRESVFEQVSTPGTLAVGDLISAAIYKCLNQSAITSLLTVSLANVSVGADVQLDDVADLQNTTVKDALDILLLISSSVLYVSGDAIIVAPRTVGATLAFSFYGQASIAGAENIISLENIRSGLNRVFNYLTWGSVLDFDGTSVAKYGVRAKDFTQTVVTDTAKRNTLLDAIKLEFALPKQELEVTTPLTYSTLALAPLNQVVIDYPTPVIPWESNPLPICGAAVLGQAVLGRGQYAFTMDTTTQFKVMGIAIDTQSAAIKFKLRTA